MLTDLQIHAKHTNYPSIGSATDSTPSNKILPQREYVDSTGPTEVGHSSVGVNNEGICTKHNSIKDTIYRSVDSTRDSVDNSSNGTNGWRNCTEYSDARDIQFRSSRDRKALNKIILQREYSDSTSSGTNTRVSDETIGRKCSDVKDTNHRTIAYITCKFENNIILEHSNEQFDAKDTNHNNTRGNNSSNKNLLDSNTKHIDVKRASNDATSEVNEEVGSTAYGDVHEVKHRNTRCLEVTSDSIALEKIVQNRNDAQVNVKSPLLLKRLHIYERFGTKYK